jgi:hypothetical protein
MFSMTRRALQNYSTPCQPKKLDNSFKKRQSFPAFAFVKKWKPEEKILSNTSSNAGKQGGQPVRVNTRHNPDTGIKLLIVIAMPLKCSYPNGARAMHNVMCTLYWAS